MLIKITTPQGEIKWINPLHIVEIYPHSQYSDARCIHMSDDSIFTMSETIDYIENEVAVWIRDTFK